MSQGSSSGMSKLGMLVRGLKFGERIDASALLFAEAARPPYISTHAHAQAQRVATHLWTTRTKLTQCAAENF